MQPCGVMLKQDFCSILVMLNSFETLPELCLVSDVGVGVDHLPTQHDIHNKESVPHSPSRQLSWPCPLMETLNFVLFHGLPFYLQFKMMDPVSYAVTVCDR
jgi:hypothetical protein